MKGFKQNVKRMLLELQGRGDAVEWQADNLLLCNISGLRKSAQLVNFIQLANVIQWFQLF